MIEVKSFSRVDDLNTSLLLGVDDSLLHHENILVLLVLNKCNFAESLVLISSDIVIVCINVALLVIIFLLKLWCLLSFLFVFA